jgi:MinD-like ATPase involved in chromosome partitioning or flagellar assembly
MIITLEDAKSLVIKNINDGLNSAPELKDNIEKIQILIIRDTLGTISFVIKCPSENAKAITQMIKEQWFQYENEYGETESFKEWLGGIFINDDDTFNLFKPNELSLEKGAENIPWLEEAIHLEAWREIAKQDEKAQKEETVKEKAKVISFYSYKGGVGRTTLAAMISLLCATKDKKIVVVDTDIEAPGLGFQFFGESGKAGYQSNGFLDFMLYPYQNLEPDKQTQFKQTFVTEFFIQNQHDLPNILLMPVAKFGDDITSDAYSQKLSRINVLQGGQEKIHLLLELINEKIEPDLVMFDLRTGITDIGGILTNKSVSDFLIFVGYPDTQTQLGLSFFFKHATKFHLDDENSANFNTIFVHSPAPLDDKKKIIPTELGSFRQMINVYVDKLSGDKKDEATETLEEFIFTIPYQANLRSLIREKGIKEVFKDGYFENVKDYQSIAEKIILLNSDENIASTETIASTNVDIFNEFKEKLKTTPLLKNVAADAETDLQNMEDIVVNFQALRDYREMLNDRIFLIIGEKGAGKSALEKVFDESKSEKLVEALVNKLDINWDIKKPTWIPATDKYFVMNIFANDYEYKKEIHEILANYGFWKIYSLGLINKFLTTQSINQEDVIKEMVNVYNETPEKLNRMYDEKLIHEKLKNQGKKVVLTYDYLDTPEYEISSESIKQLMLLWYRLKLNPDFSYLNAKIFLREDLVQKIEWADKGKMRSNHSYEIRWDFYKLMTVLLKRLCARSEAFFEKLKTELSKRDILLDKTPIDDNKHIVFFPEKPEAVDIAIKLLFGEKITQSSSKSFLERYLWNGTTLNHEKQYNARFMLKFMHSALEECKQSAKDGIFDIYTPLKQKYGSIAIKWVKDEVYEMHPELKPYIQKIKEKATTESENFKGGRINASQLKDYLNAGEEEKIKIMKALEEIGFIKKKKGDYDDITKLEFYFPELYRAFLGIKKVNSLPPS